MILKIPGQDSNFGVKVTNPTVLNKQSAVIFREVIGHGGGGVLLSHSSSSMLPKHASATMQ